MIKISVKLDVASLRRQLKGAERKVDRAMASAMNRAIDSTATAAAKEISAATKIKQAHIRSRLVRRRASASHLIAELEALPFSPNLKYFRATQTKRGVTASAWERRKLYRHAFINPRGSVVARKGKGRFPLKGLRGPSLPRTFMQRRILAKLEAVCRATWRSRLDHEVARAMKGSLA